MQRIIDGFFRALEHLLVACLTLMVFMVLGNVILRYTMNSGIDISEELSRYLFVWLTFIGAVVAFREGAHLGVDSLVAKLSRTGKMVCLVLSDLLMLVCCAVFFWGTWQQAGINLTNKATISGISMLWVYGVGFFTSTSIAVMIVAKLVRAATGRLSDAELVEVVENEGLKEAEAIANTAALKR